MDDISEQETQGKTWRQWSYDLTIFSSILSLIITPIAILFYGGGTSDNPSSPGFSLLDNFLSDLGRLVAFSGNSNLISSILFNTSLLLFGVFLIFYFAALPEFFKGLKEARWFSLAGSAIGIVLAITMIGGSLTPSDIFRSVHLTFGALAFVIALPVVIFYTFAILGNPKFPNQYAVTYIGLGVILVVYLGLLLSGGATGEIAVYFTVGQKVVVLGILVCFLIEAYGTKQLYRNTN